MRVQTIGTGRALDVLAGRMGISTTNVSIQCSVGVTPGDGIFSRCNWSRSCRPATSYYGTTRPCLNRSKTQTLSAYQDVHRKWNLAGRFNLCMTSVARRCGVRSRSVRKHGR